MNLYGFLDSWPVVNCVEVVFWTHWWHTGIRVLHYSNYTIITIWVVQVLHLGSDSCLTLQWFQPSVTIHQQTLVTHLLNLCETDFGHCQKPWRKVGFRAGSRPKWYLYGSNHAPTWLVWATLPVRVYCRERCLTPSLIRSAVMWCVQKQVPTPPWATAALVMRGPSWYTLVQPDSFYPGRLSTSPAEGLWLALKTDTDGRLWQVSYPT